MKLRRWLVICADGEIRVRTRRPKTNDLAIFEFAVPITLDIPDGWGSVIDHEIEVTLPAPPVVEPGEFTGSVSVNVDQVGGES